MDNSPRLERVLVDPDQARRWLAGIPADYAAKRLRGQEVAHYMERMRKGEWEDSLADTVTIDENGIVLTGLTPLLAVILANVRIWMCVEMDVPRSKIPLVYEGGPQPDLLDFAHAPERGF